MGYEAEEALLLLRARASRCDKLLQARKLKSEESSPNRAYFDISTRVVKRREFSIYLLDLPTMQAS